MYYEISRRNDEKDEVKSRTIEWRSGTRIIFVGGPVQEYFNEHNLIKSSVRIDK